MYVLGQSNYDFFQKENHSIFIILHYMMINVFNFTNNMFDFAIKDKWQEM